MSQMSLFDSDQHSEVIIPEDVISPLESNKSVKSKEFKKQQQRWSDYVKTIQDSYGCSWFEARKLLMQHRDNQSPIKARIS